MLTVLLLLAPAAIPSASGVKTGMENVPRTIPPPRQPNHASEPPANVHAGECSIYTQKGRRDTTSRRLTRMRETLPIRLEAQTHAEQPRLRQTRYHTHIDGGKPTPTARCMGAVSLWAQFPAVPDETLTRRAIVERRACHL